MTDFNRFPDPAEARISPEAQLSPEEMLALSTELLSDFEVEFPDMGAIPVEMDPDSEGFQSGNKARVLYTPGVGDRSFFDPSRTGRNSPNPKDFATWFMQCFGKTVTMRIRGNHPEPEELLHNKVPRITKELLSAKSPDETEVLHRELAEVIAHNLNLSPDNPDVRAAMSAHAWMIDRLSARLAHGETA